MLGVSDNQDHKCIPMRTEPVAKQVHTRDGHSRYDKGTVENSLSMTSDILIKILVYIYSPFLFVAKLLCFLLLQEALVFDSSILVH